MGWSSSCQVVRGPRHLTDRLWQLINASLTGEIPDDIEEGADLELEDAVDDHGCFLDMKQELLDRMSREGASVTAHSVKYEYTDALWDEIKPLIPTSAAIECFESGDCEGTDYARITDPSVLLRAATSMTSVRNRMRRSMDAALEQFTRDDGRYSHPYGRQAGDPELLDEASRLRSGTCTSCNLPLQSRERALVDTLERMQRLCQQSHAAESRALDGPGSQDEGSDDDLGPGCRDGSDDYGGHDDYGGYDDCDIGGGFGFSPLRQRQGERLSNRRIAYEFAIDHLREALEACRELRRSQVSGVPSSSLSGSSRTTDPDPIAPPRPARSKREELHALCRDAIVAGQHVVVVHDVV